MGPGAVTGGASTWSMVDQGEEELPFRDPTTTRPCTLAVALPRGWSVTFGPYTSPTTFSGTELFNASVRARPWSKTRAKPDPPGAFRVRGGVGGVGFEELVAAPVKRGGLPLGQRAATTVPSAQALQVKKRRTSGASAMSDTESVLPGLPVT